MGQTFVIWASAASSAPSAPDAIVQAHCHGCNGRGGWQQGWQDHGGSKG